MKIMLSAGEASGDMHGASLIKAIKDLHPDAIFFGMGGKQMQNAGMDLLFNPTEIGAFGFVEVIKLIPLASKIRSLLLKTIDEKKPDVLVLIDYPGFNLKLGELAKAKGIKCVYYFSPSAWAWGKGRAKRVARSCRRVASVFPFEEKVYREAGANVEFVGHPLKDMVKRTIENDTLRAQLGLAADDKVIALCPGSRAKEITSLYDEMLGAAKILSSQLPGVRFVSPVAPTIPEDDLKARSQNAGVDVIYHKGNIYDLFSVSDIAIIASGTATLEAALANVPMIIVYKVASLTYLLGKLLVKIPNIGLPNIVAGRRVVPELIQEHANAREIASEVLNILRRTDIYEGMREDLRRVSTALGNEGAVNRTAKLVLRVAEDE